MNILFLPYNIASLASITANALNKIEGIHARNITDSIHKYQSPALNTILLPDRFVSRLQPFKRFKAKRKYKRELKKWIKWADVLHYVFSPAYKNGKDLKWAKDQNKVIIIEWLGSDIRDPEVLFKINPHYSKAFNNGYEYKNAEESQNKNKVQRLFAKVKAIPFVYPELSLFLNRKLFPQYFTANQRLTLSNFTPHYPYANNRCPIIVHSPTAKIAKGTNLILPVIEELKKDYDFKFVLLHDISRDEALEIMQNADIFLDQIIIGSHGMACTEAMAFGKPVMCYIMQEVFNAGLPKDFPVINTNPDNLKEQLIKLITSPQLRHDIGKQSRAYAEKHFDADKTALQLLKIYKDALDKKDQ